MPHSGKFGVVNGQSAVRNWQINNTSTPAKYVASNTKGAPGRNPGPKDWTGSFSAYGGEPAVLPGEKFSFVGYTAPTDKALGGVGITYEGTAVVDSVVVNWNWESGENVNYVVNFSGDGALTRGTGSHTDDSEVEVHGTTGLAVALDGDAAICVATATLTLNASNSAYVNSCTSGWNGRESGVLDAMLSLTIHARDLEAIDSGADIGDYFALRLYVNDADYWLLKWMQLKDQTGLTVDIETGAVISYTAAFEFSAFEAGGGTPGQLLLPSGAALWPPTEGS